jgi:hypothetical protein
MPKKIKTRKQKLHSDLRKETTGHSLTLPVMPIKEIDQQASVMQQQSTTMREITAYAYLGSDLSKTLIVSISIVILEILLRFFVIKS